MTEGLDFRLFGNCWIEQPCQKELEAISQYIPSMAALEALLPSGIEIRSEWDWHDAFTDLIKEDTGAWERLNAKHTRYFTQPSGSIQSALAVHLINPTFYVEDVNNQEADDPTNPTISLLHDAGLSSSGCILFDSLNVRARTEDMKKFYTDDLWKPHHDFVQKLRASMWATVEICMGKDAFEDLSKSAILKPFPLWGKFEKVRLWVEVDNNQTSVKRFVVQAYHPAFFPKSKRGPNFDENFSKPQDLAILMARQLAKLPQAKTPHYFESAFVRGEFAHLSPQAETKRKECERLAMDAFEKAFPNKCMKVQVARQFKELKIKAEIALIDKMKGLEPLVPMQVPSVEILSLEGQELRRRGRYAAIRSTVESFRVATIEADRDDDECCDFEDLPDDLRTWIQSEHVFALLDTNNIYYKEFSIHDLAVLVGVLLLEKIQKNQQTNRSSLKNTEAIPGKPGEVIYRTCSMCKKPFLDDAFPLFLTAVPEFYFIEVIHSTFPGGAGCGQQGCNGWPALMPADPKQRHTRLEMRSIKRVTLAGLNPTWKDALCRTGKDLQGCASSLKIRCCGPGVNGVSRCEYQREYVTSSWTIQEPPRVVMPKLMCKIEEKEHSFAPVDSNIRYITLANLLKTHKAFLNEGCELSEYPKIAEFIFPTANTSFKARFKLLKAAQKLSNGTSPERKGKAQPDEEPRPKRQKA
ncbi:hypothetical protein N7501_004260 [Penicillium viridicatum]|nr:hypothetical protein N7501_004260 [Penicillium viridicatum]